MLTNHRVTCHIRWMVRHDLPEVLAIEQACFDCPWGENEFLRILRQRSSIGMVADASNRVVGFMLYELHKDMIEILNFAVHPDLTRKGIGSQMVAKLVGKLSVHRRTEIVVRVHEVDLNAQFFFSKQGFRAIKVDRDYFDEPQGDAYVMVYQLA